MKWFLWHDKAEDALKRLSEIKSTVTDNEKLLTELEDLYVGLWINSCKKIKNYLT